MSLIKSKPNHGKKFTYYIAPILNPDGYEYSRTNDRMWRKNRAPNPMKWCRGVDLNRNWDFHWNEVGASSLSCSDIYAGPSANSEPEVQAVAKFLTSEKGIKLYLTLHSFGQDWLRPWGYNGLETNSNSLKKLAQKAVRSIEKTNGMIYRSVNSGRAYGNAGGVSDDWAKGVAGIKYSYTVELRDDGEQGFLLPDDQIIPTGQEIYKAVRASASFIEKKVKNSKKGKK